MKAGADLKQAGHASPDNRAPLSGLGDPAKDLEQRALACSVTADDPQHLAAPNLERHVLQCPEFFDLSSIDDLPSTRHVEGRARNAPGMSSNRLPEGLLASAIGRLVSDQVALAEVFDFDDDFVVQHVPVNEAVGTLAYSVSSCERT